MKKTSSAESNKTVSRNRSAKSAKRRERNPAHARIAREVTPPTVEFARDALLHALRTTVHRSGLLVVDMMLVLHEGRPRSPIVGNPIQVGDRPWWLDVVPKPPGGLPGPEGEVPVARDTVVAVYLDGKKVHFFTWPPEDLLPESVPDAGLPHPSGHQLVPLKTLLWSIYKTDEVPEDDVSAYRRFHERVRAAVVTEIAAPGEKRALIDIVYDIAGGPQLEANLKSGADGLSKATLLRSLAGESLS